MANTNEQFENVEDGMGGDSGDSGGSTGKQRDYADVLEFDDMGLSEGLLRGICSYGFEKPSTIQSKAIMPIIAGEDVIGQSQSGTGKTATFLIGTLQRVDKDLKCPQVLILSPNRELSMQIYEVLGSLNEFLKVTATLVIGGTKVEDNFKDLDSGVQYIIGTPGRVFDMIKRYALKTDELKSFVLDEADEMLSRGFKDQIYDIFQYVPKKAQICLFSATMPEIALELTQKFMTNPLKILVNRQELTLEGIKQYYLGLEQESWKIPTLCDLFAKLSLNQTIIFANSKRKVIYIKDMLEQEGYAAECIHGDMTQAMRTAQMQNFRRGDSRVLITTDIIARGIDVQQVSTVINYDVPKYREIYIHRIGRSGRFGRKGVAINFVTEKEYTQLQDIIQFYNTQMETLPENIKDLL